MIIEERQSEPKPVTETQTGLARDSHPAPTDPSHLTLVERVIHESPVVRKSGFEEIVSQLDMQTALSDPQLATMLTEDCDVLFSESDPVNQALVLRIYERLSGESAETPARWKPSKKAFWYNFVIKFLNSTRPEIREQSSAFFAKLFASVDKTQFVKVCFELLKANNVGLLKQVYLILNNNFSAFHCMESVMDGVLETLSKHIGDVRPDVRNGSVALLKNLSVVNSDKALGAMKKLSDKLREEVLGFVQERRREGLGGSRGHESGRSSVRRTSARKSVSGQKVDLYPVSKPVSLGPKFNEGWVEETLQLTKWSDKKDEVEKLLRAGNVKRLNEKDCYSHVFELAKRLVSQSNVQLHICGVRVIGMLAHGLRKHARALLKNHLKDMLASLKDKNQQVAKAYHLALIETFHVFRPEELFDELRLYNERRNKDIRLNLLTVLKNWLEFTCTWPEQQESLNFVVKCIAQIANAYYEDPDIEVRNETNKTVVESLDRLVKRPEQHESLLKLIAPNKLKNYKRLEGEVAKGGQSKDDHRVSMSGSKVKAKAKKHVGSRLETDRGTPTKQEVDLAVGKDIADKIWASDWTSKGVGLAELRGFLSGMAGEFVDGKFVKAVAGCLRSTGMQLSGPNESIDRLLIGCFDALVAKGECLELLLEEFVPLFMGGGVGGPGCVSVLKGLRDGLGFDRVLAVVAAMFGTVRDSPKGLLKVCSVLEELADRNSVVAPSDLKVVLLPGLNHPNQATKNASRSLLEKLAANLSSHSCKDLLRQVENENLRILLESQVLPLTIASDKWSRSKAEGHSRRDKQSASRHSRFPTASTDVKAPKLSGRTVANGRAQLGKSVSDSRRAKLDDSLNSSQPHLGRLESVAKSSESEIASGIINQNPETRKHYFKQLMDMIRSNQMLLSQSRADRTFETIRLRLNDSNVGVSKFAVCEFHSLFDDAFPRFRFVHKQVLSCFLDLLLHKNVG